MVLRTLHFPERWDWFLPIRFMGDPRFHFYKRLLREESLSWGEGPFWGNHKLWRWVACLPTQMTSPDHFKHLEILRLSFWSSFLPDMTRPATLVIAMAIIIIIIDNIYRALTSRSVIRALYTYKSFIHLFKPPKNLENRCYYYPILQ